MLKKNTASQNITFVLIKAADGTALTGATVTAKRCIDGAAQASVTGSVTETAGGQYLFAPSQADTNGDLIGYLFTATSAIPVNIHVRTTAADLSDAVRLGLTAMPNAAAEASGGLYTRGTGAGQINQDANGRIDANVKTWIGGAIPAVNVTGVPLVDAKYLMGTVMTDTSGRLAAGFSTFFNIVSPTSTMNLITACTTVTTVTNQLTAAAIATGVWQDSTAGDFTTASSIGKSLYTSGVVPGGTNGLFIAGTNAATSITTGLTAHIIGTVDTVTTVTNQLTAAAIATGVWQDSTAGDFTTASSIGKSLYTSGVVPGGTNGLFIAGTNAATTITTALTTTFTGNLTGNVAGSVGSVGSAVTLSAGDSPVTRTGTAQAGANTTITLDSGASATNNAYTGCLVKITSGTGASAGQCRTIASYVGSTKVATVDYAWEVNPDATSVFAVLYADSPALNSSLQVTASSISGVTFPSNFSALGISAGGHISNVDTLTTYTGNTVQTGDNFARIGATGSGLTSLAQASSWTSTLATNLGTLAGHDPGTTLGTSTLTQTQVTGGAYSVQSASCVLGDARIAHLDADVSSRMATYTQPSGFLAATFPTGTVANTTNITAGTITTTTNLTNLPAITTDWLTGTGVAASAVTKIQAGLSTYAGGDTAGTTTLLARLTSTRAGYIDNLSAGAVALASQIPANFTTATFASAGVFATAALANAPGGSAPTAAQNAAAVWDLATSGHTTVATFGAAMVAAGSAGDPWSTAQPGSYAAGTFGYLIAHTMAASVASAASSLLVLVAGPTTITAETVIPADGGTATIYAGSDYLASNGLPLSWTRSGLPSSLTGGTARLKIYPGMDRWASDGVTAVTPDYDIVGTLTLVSAGVYTFDFDLTATQSLTLSRYPQARHLLEVRAIDTLGHVAVEIIGDAVVK